MTELKTKPSNQSVTAFLAGVQPADRRKDCRTLVRMMKAATGAAPKMWGPSIVGFGSYHYKYDSGREGDWFLTGFSPRKTDLTLYIMAGFARCDALMKKLGRHRTGKSCLYIKRLDDVDGRVLSRLVRESVRHMSKKQA